MKKEKNVGKSTDSKKGKNKQKKKKKSIQVPEEDSQKRMHQIVDVKHVAPN